MNETWNLNSKNDIYCIQFNNNNINLSTDFKCSALLSFLLSKKNTYFAKKNYLLVS